MPLSAEAQALFDHARNSLPRWISNGKQAALEWLYGLVAMFDPVRTQAQSWLDGVYLNTATGRWLDQHAKDRDTTRRLNETDAVLRERLRQVEDSITDYALQRGINRILGKTVTLATAQTLTITDVVSGTKIINVPAATYQFNDLIDLIEDGLSPGWSIRVINAKVVIRAVHPTTGAEMLMTAVWSTALRTALNMIDIAGTYSEQNLGIYQSSAPISGLCAITHLRRDRAHCEKVPTAYVVSESTTITMTDEVNPAGNAVIDPGTYTPAALATLIAASAPAGWTVTQTNGRLSFAYAPSIFSVAWSNQRTMQTCGYRANAVDWDSPLNGPYKAYGPRAYMNRGYRLTNALRPMTYVALLPSPTTQATANAVKEYLRQFGPAGFNAQVEFKV